MDRALVVIRADDDISLIEEAVTLAAGVDAHVVVLSLLTPEEFEKDAAVLDTIESVENVESGGHSPDELSTAIGRELFKDALAETSVEVDADIVGAVSGEDHSETALAVARRKDCDHIFIAGGKRSPAGKALFGDFAQSVLLGFDGYVTVRMTD
jgi:nucleotide-binding universal stress UspA family protein